jgi:hypothetical protein
LRWDLYNYQRLLSIACGFKYFVVPSYEVLEKFVNKELLISVVFRHLKTRCVHNSQSQIERFTTANLPCFLYLGSHHCEILK